MRAFDLISLGRAGVDLYAEQIGAPLEDASTFAKYLGGCAANVAVGAARQGLRTAMLTRVGDEHLGRFVRAALAAEGVDTSHVGTDPGRLTGLAILGIRDRHTFPLVFYRDNCADMAIDTADFSPAFIASARTLLVTGTHFSTSHADRVSRAAMELAQRSGTRIVLDIDYRPVLWGLTGRGLGEERFVASDQVSAHLQSIVAGCDLVVGTEEEMHIAGGSTDTLTALRRLRALTAAPLVVKRGPEGCVVFAGAIPGSLEEGLVARGFPVQVLNVLGAGDAFLSGFLRGWIAGEPLERCCAYANAAGALVASRHGCAPAMPTRIELDDFLERRRTDARLDHLHRATSRGDRRTELCVLAFDHRTQLERMAREAGAGLERLAALKSLLARAALRAAQRTGETAAGVLVDDRYGAEALAEVTGSGLWIGRPVERPGARPLAFEAEPALALRAWPRAHVAKCLLSYHPDDHPDLREIQEEALARLFQAALATERELLLEVIPPPEMPADARTMARALERIYRRGIRPDWWKLPAPTAREEWDQIAAVIAAEDPHCRGVLLLGRDAPEAEVERGFRVASGADVCKGFAVGRTIFAGPARAWLSGTCGDAALVEQVAAGFERLIAAWRKREP